MHQHDFYELVIVIAGRAIHVTETEEYKISKGDVFLVKPGKLHGYNDINKFALVNILYQPDRLHLPFCDLTLSSGYQILFELEPELRPSFGMMRHLHLDDITLEVVKQKLEHLNMALQDSAPGHKFRAIAFFMELISILSDYFSSVSIISSEYNDIFKLGKILSYLETHFTDTLFISRLERIFSISKSKMYRLFIQGTGMSPNQYLSKLRITHAKSMLLNTVLPVTDIALQCGFQDSNYFTRIFKQHTYCSPREYRNNYVSDNDLKNQNA